ncbi:sphingomyelin phosphodiesterase-like protein 2, partial [Dinothrombium tinctorium]
QSLEVNSTSAIIDHQLLQHNYQLNGSTNILNRILETLISFENTLIITPAKGILRKGFFLARIFAALIRIMPFKTFLFEVKDGLVTQASCLTCRILTTILKSTIYSTDLLAFTTQMVCSIFRIQTYEVCSGVVASFKDTLHFIRFNSVLSSSEMCGIFIGLNCASEITNNLNWTIPLPKRQQINQNFQTSLDRPHMLVAHFTDVHLDPFYAPGSRTDCEEPVCCRSQANLMSNLPTFSGVWGDYRKCDTPLSTVNNAIEQISRHNLSYALWTGDIPPHDIWRYTRESNVINIEKLAHILKTNFKIPVLPAVGNHEAVPINSKEISFAPPEIDESLSNSWLYEKLAFEFFPKWLARRSYDTFRRSGNYMVRMKQGFRLISLNTNYCLRLNPWILYKTIDPGDQLNFLATELLNAEKSGDKVHIIGHVPPDHRECTQPWLLNFIRIIQRFKDTILAQFYGHTHRDEFRVLYSPDEPSETIGFELIAPSITSYSGTNTAYRIYKVDQAATIIDYETFVFNLTKTYLGEMPHWISEYKAFSLFNQKQISAKILHDFLQKLERNDTLYDFYH